MLVQRAAARDVEHLHAAADGQDRQPAGVGGPGQRQLELVELGLDRAGARVAALAVGTRVQVRTARTGRARRRGRAATRPARPAAAGTTIGIAPAASSAWRYLRPSAISCCGGSPCRRQGHGLHPAHLGRGDRDQRSRVARIHAQHVLRYLMPANRGSRSRQSGTRVGGSPMPTGQRTLARGPSLAAGGRPRPARVPGPAPEAVQVPAVMVEIAGDVRDDRRLHFPGWSASRGARPAAGDPPAARLGAGATRAAELRLSRPRPPGLPGGAAVADRAADRRDGDGLGSGPARRRGRRRTARDLRDLPRGDHAP